MSHRHNLSINSITSLIEPTTPPTHQSQQITPATSSASGSSSSNFHNRSLSNGFTKSTSTSITGKSMLWDSSTKLNHNLNLPNFGINDKNVLSTPLMIPSLDADESSSTINCQTSLGKLSIRTTTSPPNINLQPITGSSSNGSTIDAGTANDATLMVGNGAVAMNSYNNAAAGGVNIGNHANNAIASGSGPGTKFTFGSEAYTSASSSATPSGSTTPSINMSQKIDKEYLASINKLPLSQLKSEILRLSKDQYGCRFLQKKIDENLISNYQVRHSNFDIIFKQIYPYMYELIIDPFGNYLIQKLIAYCNEANLNLLLEILQFNLFQISINQHGTRALQKIIDNLNNSYQLGLLIKGLKPYIIELIKDLNGNHVIQKILNKYQPEDCQFIYDSIIDELYTVATHKHGCCVLQKCLNHVTPKQLDEFAASILKFENFKMLINDQFGNYVLQYLISINSMDMNYRIFENFVKFDIDHLCNLKFSSNVVEKFLKNCYNNETNNVAFANLKFELIYNILMNDLNKLINDPYGNYVIQTMIDILVNPHVDYSRVEKLSLVLPESFENEGSQQQGFQILIIKYWFQNCKIVSSFGKRIQSKINTILNTSSSTSTTPNLNISQNQQKFINKKSQMNANGEFVVNDSYFPGKQQQQQSFHLRNASSPTNILGNNVDHAMAYGQPMFAEQKINRNFSLPTTFYPNANGNSVSPQPTNTSSFIPSNNYGAKQQQPFVNEYPYAVQQQSQQTMAIPNQFMPQQIPLDTQFNGNQPFYANHHKQQSSSISEIPQQSSGIPSIQNQSVTSGHYTTAYIQNQQYTPSPPPPHPQQQQQQQGGYFPQPQLMQQGQFYAGPPPHPPAGMQNGAQHVPSQQFYRQLQNNGHAYSGSWSSTTSSVQAGNNALFGSNNPKW
ncbi:MPT5 [[Candida] subhashii]|uniref:MPT5 n=1 Tax=[Candida] subhashii TaxID=561895 RepID=A0A8J5ULE1_9ASCO|nr:MPT5 [[Candida] subhashii]KAG7662776.1 MPT5 [[Candida] subhashii]